MTNREKSRAKALLVLEIFKFKDFYCDVILEQLSPRGTFTEIWKTEGLIIFEIIELDQ